MYILWPEGKTYGVWLGFDGKDYCSCLGKWVKANRFILCKLVETYAETLASHGLLTTAMEYLKLLGSHELWTCDLKGWHFTLQNLVHAFHRIFDVVLEPGWLLDEVLYCFFSVIFLACVIFHFDLQTLPHSAFCILLFHLKSYVYMWSFWYKHSCFGIISSLINEPRILLLLSANIIEEIWFGLSIILGNLFHLIIKTIQFPSNLSKMKDFSSYFNNSTES
jgi:hypothetical protein